MTLEQRELKLDSVPYGLDNVEVLKHLGGLKINMIYRASEYDDEEALHDYSPIVIEFENDYVVVFVLDEGTSNIILLDNINHQKRVTTILDRNKYRSFIVCERKSEFFSDIDFNETIQKIEVIRKEHEYIGWHVMSGVGIVYSSNSIIIGTVLTDIEVQGVWVLKPTELNHDWERVDLMTAQ